MGGDADVVGAIEVVEREGEHAVDAEGARVVAGQPAGFRHGTLGDVVGLGVAGADGLLGGELGEREPGAGVVGRRGHALSEGDEALLVALDAGRSGLVAGVAAGGEEAGDRDRRGGECRRHDEDPADPEGTTGASPGCDGRAHVLVRRPSGVVARAGRSQVQVHLLVQPMGAVLALELDLQMLVDLDQMRHVGQRIDELLFR